MLTCTSTIPNTKLCTAQQHIFAWKRLKNQPAQQTGWLPSVENCTARNTAKNAVLSTQKQVFSETKKKKNTKWFLLFLSYSQALTEMCLAWKSQKSFLGPACCNWELYFKQMPPATAEPEGEAATPATCGNSKGGMIHLWCRRKVCMCQLGKMQRSLMMCEFVGLAWFQWCRGCTWRYLGTGWQGSDKHLLD